MKFKVEISKDNIVSFNEFVVKKLQTKTEMNNKVFALGNLIWVFAILSLYSIYKFYKRDCCISYKEINTALIFMGLTVTTYWIWYKLYLKVYYNNQGVDGQISSGLWEMELDEQGLYERNDLCTFQYKWQCLKSIEYDEKNCYLFIDSVRAVILPRNQLPEHCESYIKEHLTRK